MVWSTQSLFTLGFTMVSSQLVTVDTDDEIDVVVDERDMRHIILEQTV